VVSPTEALLRILHESNPLKSLDWMRRVSDICVMVGQPRDIAGEYATRYQLLSSGMTEMSELG
jgi:hypothetical protein